ncbi:glycine-rich cell wall structural protein [Folsomia candida]|nr:glycine-rich cell wall structural protein [Folsomia candida]
MRLFSKKSESSSTLIHPQRHLAADLPQNQIKMMNKSTFVILLVVGMLALSFLPPDVEGATTKGEQLERVKRGHHGHGGGGHGPGSGGGAAGPVYFCGWVGKTEGYRGYGHGK